MRVMPLDAPGPDEVLALHYDVACAAADLAAWCDGELVEGEGDEPPIVYVPTVNGPKALLLGMWVKRLPDGTHDVDTAEAFAAKHAPA